MLFAFVCIGLAVIEELGGGPEKSALVCNPTGSYGFSRKKTRFLAYFFNLGYLQIIYHMERLFLTK